MRTEWVKNDWFSSTLIVSCDNCNGIVATEVYTIPYTEKSKEKEAKRFMKTLLPICPKCGKHA